jgi:hypothetical protein
VRRKKINKKKHHFNIYKRIISTNIRTRQELSGAYFGRA